MKKYNVKLSFTPEQWEEVIAGRSNSTFDDYFNGEMEFDMDIPDDPFSPESQTIIIDEFGRRGIPYAQLNRDDPNADYFYVDGTIFEEHGAYNDLTVAVFTPIPDEHNEPLITVVGQ